jgi:hypothetical protein
MADRVTQLPVEVLLSGGAARVTQLPVEVLVQDQPITRVLLTQLPVEVLVPVTYPYDKQIVWVETL